MKRERAARCEVRGQRRSGEIHATKRCAMRVRRQGARATGITQSSLSLSLTRRHVFYVPRSAMLGPKRK